LFYHNLQRADIRWGGSESGTVAYPCWGTYETPTWFNNKGVDIDFRPLKYGNPDGAYYIPAMSDAPLRGYNGRHEWFWEPGDEEHIFPLEQLMDKYYKSVGRNSTLIMGLTPDPTGLLPEPDVQRLKEWGAEIKSRFAVPLAKTSGKGKNLIISLNERSNINHIVLQEDISKGERVRKFTLEGKTKNGWQSLFDGSSIGHKFIHVFDEIEVSHIRLKIIESIGEPMIQSFEIFSVKDKGV
jgi:hypothetical protein